MRPGRCREIVEALVMNKAPNPSQCQLLVYEFGPGAELEGRLVGALERIQAAEESRVADGLFISNDVGTGELAAIDLRSGSAAASVARLLTFRSDPGARRHATERALGEKGSVPGEVVRDLGGLLKPGGAMLALLVERPAWGELGDAVARTGGWLLSAELVRSSTLAELAPKLVEALGGNVAGGAP